MHQVPLHMLYHSGRIPVTNVAFSSQTLTDRLTLLAGYRIPKGTSMTASMWTMHRDEAVWRNADKYVPERWIDGTPEAVGRPEHAWAPFGDGPRKCVAYKFALAEAKIAIIRLYQKFDFELAPGRVQVPLPLSFGITVCPADGIHVKVHSRAKA